MKKDDIEKRGNMSEFWDVMNPTKIPLLNVKNNKAKKTLIKIQILKKKLDH